MAFLQLNGLIVPVMAEKFGKSVDVVGGERKRTLSGALRATFIANKRRWQGATAPLPPDEADAWRRLFLGECDAVSWDAHLYSSKGLPPISVNGAQRATGNDKFGSYVLTGSGSLVYDFALTGAWTYAVWKYNGSEWVHYVVRSDGAKWLQGARNDGLAVPLTVEVDGSLALPPGQRFDDLVVFPFPVPLSWPPALYASGAAFSYPALSATGTGIEGAPRTVLPLYSGADAMRAAGGHVESIGFELEEA